MALVPAAQASEVSAADFEADELLAKPFSNDALQQLVRRCLQPVPRRPVEEPADSEQLTSADIFGDVLAEVEAEAEARRSKAAAPEVRQPERPMDDIERKLEETLAGVIPLAGKSKRPSGARKDRRPELQTETEIDNLLDQTLSSLDIPTRRRKKPAADAPGRLETPDRDPESVRKPAAADLAHGPADPSKSPEIAGAVGVDQIRLEDQFRTQALPAHELIKHVEQAEKETDGEAFGDYTLLDRIAVGGMAEVWRARRRGVEGFQKTVAIKKILSHLTGSSDFVTMFIDEAKLAAQLTHNNIIQIYDLGKVGDDFFIAMELVDGKDLRSILNAAQETGRPIPVHVGLSIVKALARALDYAHRKRDFENRALRLVHRDVSPQNVLISWEGEIKLCDFGIVKAVAKASITQMGALKGKLQYMSPEQAWGKEVDARSDIFSLGSVLFEVLTGTQLFEADTEIGVLDAVRECRIRSARELVPEIPEEVDRTLKKALAPTPEARFQTAGELEHELQAALDVMRPAPSQKDLAAYLRSLFSASDAAAVPRPAVEPPELEAPELVELEAPELEPDLETPDLADLETPPAEPPTLEPEAALVLEPPAAEPPAGEEPPPASEAQEPPEETEPAPVEPVGPTLAEPAPTEPPAELQAVPADPAVSAVPIEESAGPEETAEREAGRGRALKWLIAAVVVGALIAAGLLWLRAPSDQPPPAVAAPAPVVEEIVPPPPADQEAAPESEAAPPAAAGGDAEIAGESTDGEAGDGEAEPSEPGQAVTAAGIDIEQLVTEELNSRAERLRQDFEAEKKRIEDELAKTRAAEPPPPEDPKPETESGGGSGDGP